MTNAKRVTRGFSIGDEDGDDNPSPRRVRTRQQIMNGEGKRPPASVELALLAHNPFNPRLVLTEIEDTTASLKVKGQITALAVVRRAAFLAAHPNQETQIGEAEYVVIDGNRRLSAALAAGLSELRIDVNDALAETAADLLEAGLLANLDRVDIPEIDQAKAVQQLLEVHGAQTRVAERLGKTPAWVSQRLALLELPEDLQRKVGSGELKVKDGRRIGRLPKEQQRKEAEAAINRVKAPRKVRTAITPAQEDVNPVNASHSDAPGVTAPLADTPVGVNPVNAGASLPEQQTGETADPLGTALDEVIRLADDPEVLADALVKRLPAQALEALTQRLLAHV